MQHAVILGKNGKLGRALNRFWRQVPPSKMEPVWLGREGVEGFAQRADVVIALWGVTSGTEEELAGNSTLGEAAIDLAKRVSARRVLHLSSAAVYGGGQGAALAESAPLDAVTPYGRAKIDMEERISAASDRKGAPESCALRLANVAGCDSLFRSLSGSAPITLDRFESGKGPERSYIGIPDLARVLEELACAKEIPAVLNVAAPRATGMAEIARAAGRDLIWQDAPASAVQKVELDTSRLNAFAEVSPRAAEAETLVRSWREFGGWE